MAIVAANHIAQSVKNYFKLPPGRLYIWKSNAETENKIIKNQIDFVLIKHRFRKSISSVKTYISAHMGSDHNPVFPAILLK